MFLKLKYYLRAAPLILNPKKSLIYIFKEQMSISIQVFKLSSNLG
jgi:hypothetical protein